MATNKNPFQGKASESTTSDAEFIRLFSPKILERIPDVAFQGGVNLFVSPPGGGKTSLLRAFNPSSLRTLHSARRSTDFDDSLALMSHRGLIDKINGVQLLGVMISCASGFADLPPAASSTSIGLFRALFDCRVVLRTLRGIAAFLGRASVSNLQDIRLEYSPESQDLKHIPIESTPADLIKWAEAKERSIYSLLDSIDSDATDGAVTHARFEGALWMQSVTFFQNSTLIAPKRLLMIDDLHKLRRTQRVSLIEELAEQRVQFPIWVAERTIAIGEGLIAQGVRSERDANKWDLSELWETKKSPKEFQSFIESILNKRFDTQTTLPRGAFLDYLRTVSERDERDNRLSTVRDKFEALVGQYRKNTRYSEWFSMADGLTSTTIENSIELFSIAILIAREEKSKQLSFDILPLSESQAEERIQSDIKGASEILLHHHLGLPYYYGFEKICQMASSNVEEALTLAAALYERLRANYIVKRGETELSPADQEKTLKETQKKRLAFIPQAHTQGSRAQKLIEAIGKYCVTRTLELNAPYAPGLTGIRLSSRELNQLLRTRNVSNGAGDTLRSVLIECIAENLLLPRESSASGSRDSGLVLYLNRGLCAYFGLPFQFGGWNDIRLDQLADWMESGRPTKKRPPMLGDF